jgi:hypothetical protein
VLNRTTLLRQSLLERSGEDVATAVGRLAGLQAQHANSPHVALWSRLRDFETASLDAALDARELVKATTIRATLHIVAAADYPAFDVASSAARVGAWAATAKRAGVDIAQIHRRLLKYAGEPRPVADLEAFVDKLAPDAAFADHAPAGVRHVAFRIVSARGGLVHAPPSGFWGSHGKPRYIAARTWLPKATDPPDGEALETLIQRYLGAYGPASLADVGRWLGERRMPRLRAAVEGLADRLRRFRAEDGRELLDLEGAPLAAGDEPGPARFLARWDSILIGYDARARMLPEKLVPAVVKKNGDFLPAFLVDGRVGGLWSTGAAKDVATLQLEPLGPIDRRHRAALADEAERLVRFMHPEAARRQVEWTQPSSL